MRLGSRAVAGLFGGTVLIGGPGLVAATTLHPELPPPAHTGGFGEPSCEICHAEYIVNAPGGELVVQGLPDEWSAGAVYLLTITLRSEEMASAGFQISARSPDGRAAGAFEALDDRVSVTEHLGPQGTVPYVAQTRIGSEAPDPSEVSWQVRWHAPSRGGEVWFHGAANSGNGDNSPFGDLVYITELRTSATSSSR